jgi:TonB family protein
MKSATKLSLFLTVTFLSSCSTAPDKAELKGPLRFDAASVTPAPAIIPGCEIPRIDNPYNAFPPPTYPIAEARNGNSGFAVFDFQIDANGKPQNVEIVASQPAKAFTEHSANALRKIKFSVNQKWAQTCTSQKFRIGYQYAFNAECDPKVFPTNMQSVCTTGYIVRMQ